MNIFVLDHDPEKAARYQCDKHVVKMILESAQIMATAIHANGMDAPYKPTHFNHPCSIWARESRDNYLWLLAHHEAMLDEYTVRYGRVHKTAQHLDCWREGSGAVPLGGLSAFAQAMPEELKIAGDAVEAYRNYYRRDKQAFATWRNGNIPEWWFRSKILAGV